MWIWTNFKHWNTKRVLNFIFWRVDFNNPYANTTHLFFMTFGVGFDHPFWQHLLNDNWGPDASFDIHIVLPRHYKCRMPFMSLWLLYMFTVINTINFIFDAYSIGLVSHKNMSIGFLIFISILENVCCIM